MYIYIYTICNTILQNTRTVTSNESNWDSLSKSKVTDVVLWLMFKSEVQLFEQAEQLQAQHQRYN